MKHIWLSGENATEHNLLPEIKSYNTRMKLRRAIEKIKLQNRIKLLREQEDDPENSDLSDGAGTNIFREVALAKLRDEKKEQEALRVQEEAETEHRRKSFQE